MRASTTNNFISAGSKLFTPWTWGDKKLFDSTSVLHPATTRLWLLGITFCSIALAFIVPLVFIIIIIELEIKVFKDLGFDKLILDNLTNRMFFSHNNTYWSSWAATMYKRRNTYLSKSTLFPYLLVNQVWLLSAAHNYQVKNWKTDERYLLWKKTNQ